MHIQDPYSQAPSSTALPNFSLSNYPSATNKTVYTFILEVINKHLPRLGKPHGVPSAVMSVLFNEPFVNVLAKYNAGSGQC